MLFRFFRAFPKKDFSQLFLAAFTPLRTASMWVFRFWAKKYLPDSKDPADADEHIKYEATQGHLPSGGGSYFFAPIF